MNMKLSATAALIGIAAAIGIIGLFAFTKKSDLPVIAIANYGQHASLEASIKGLKDELTEQGFIDGKTIIYEIADVGFDPSLIPQMITKLKGSNPKIMIVKSTPVAQFAKGKIRDIPLIYCDITDPVEAGVIKTKNKSCENVCGSSDQEKLVPLLNFAKKLLPHAKTVGVLYSTSESNDAALIKMMRQAASDAGLKVLAVPVDQSRDIPMRMQEFKGKIDFIYVGTSGPIQPALPIIASEAGKMNIPVFNSEDQAVRDGLVLASFGVSYEAVGRNAGKLVVKLLRGASMKDLTPMYPTTQDHHCFVNKKLAKKFEIEVPKNVIVVE